ncbi:hypothetical protein O3P69_004656 [Scylla paramamosain]|uniref:Uncharacterized protein n=1 Tax=Scylla paramamosain TaxID=85552 RepID=A0AAW0UCP8_SCYPA
MVVVEVDSNTTKEDRLTSELWGKSSRSCRVVILHNTQSSIIIKNRNFNINSKNKSITNDNHNKQCIMAALSILERAGLRKFPEMVFIAIGELSGMEAVLLHHALRNTVVGLYMVIHHPGSVYVTPGSRILPSELLQPEQFTDLKGQTLSVVSVPHFPYVDYERSKEGKGGVVTLRDTIDARLLQTFSEKINFTQCPGLNAVAADMVVVDTMDEDVEGGSFHHEMLEV